MGRINNITKTMRIKVFCMDAFGHIVGGLVTSSEETANAYIARKHSCGLITIKTR